MLGKVFRPIIDPVTTVAGRSLARARISANVLTTLGIAAVLAVAWVIATGRTTLAGLLLIPAVILDVLDGAAARATGTASRWGAFYDSVADRITDGALLGAIAWLAHDREDASLLAASLVALVFTFLVPYARAKAEALGYTTVTGPGERAERAVILIVGLILGVVEAAVWVTVVVTAITFVQRCASVWRQARRG